MLPARKRKGALGLVLVASRLAPADVLAERNAAPRQLELDLAPSPTRTDLLLAERFAYLLSSTRCFFWAIASAESMAGRP
jgi:hypothetical protein